MTNKIDLDGIISEVVDAHGGQGPIGALIRDCMTPIANTYYSGSGLMDMGLIEGGVKVGHSFKNAC